MDVGMDWTFSLYFGSIHFILFSTKPSSQGLLERSITILNGVDGVLLMIAFCLMAKNLKCSLLFTILPYCFNFLTIDLTVLQGIFNDLEIFLYSSNALCFLTTFFLYGVSSAAILTNQKLDLSDKGVFMSLKI